MPILRSRELGSTPRTMAQLPLASHPTTAPLHRSVQQMNSSTKCRSGGGGIFHTQQCWMEARTRRNHQWQHAGKGQAAFSPTALPGRCSGALQSCTYPGAAPCVVGLLGARRECVCAGAKSAGSISRSSCIKNRARQHTKNLSVFQAFLFSRMKSSSGDAVPGSPAAPRQLAERGTQKPIALGTARWAMGTRSEAQPLPGHPSELLAAPAFACQQQQGPALVSVGLFLYESFQALGVLATAAEEQSLCKELECCSGQSHSKACRHPLESCVSSVLLSLPAR